MSPTVDMGLLPIQASKISPDGRCTFVAHRVQNADLAMCLMGDFGWMVYLTVAFCLCIYM